MKKFIGFLVLVSFVLAGFCVAQAREMAFIDVKRVILESEAGKAAGHDLQKFMEDKKNKRMELESKLQGLQADLKKQASVLPESAYKEKELDYQKEYRDYKRFMEDTNAEVQLKDQELSRKLIPEVLKVADSIGKKGGYSCIMDIGGSGVVYYSKENDITKEVVEAYNKAYGSNK